MSQHERAAIELYSSWNVRKKGGESKHKALKWKKLWSRITN